MYFSPLALAVFHSCSLCSGERLVVVPARRNSTPIHPNLSWPVLLSTSSAEKGMCEVPCLVEGALGKELSWTPSSTVSSLVESSEERYKKVKLAGKEEWTSERENSRRISSSSELSFSSFCLSLCVRFLSWSLAKSSDLSLWASLSWRCGGESEGKVSRSRGSLDSLSSKYGSRNGSSSEDGKGSGPASSSMFTAGGVWQANQHGAQEDQWSHHSVGKGCKKPDRSKGRKFYIAMT